MVHRPQFKFRKEGITIVQSFEFGATQLREEVRVYRSSSIVRS
jgi:hypothetical protein